MTLKTAFSSVLPLLLLVSATGWGGSILRFFRFRFSRRSEAFVVESLIGLGVMGNVLLLFGLVGLFYRAMLWAVLGMGIVFSLRGNIRIESALNLKRWLVKQDLFCWNSIGLGGLIVLCSIVRLNVPATTADEISYHLYLPKVFLMRHAVFYWPYHVNSGFPQLVELLYSFGVSLSSIVAIKGVHFLFGILTSMCLYSFSKLLFKEIQGWQASLLFLTVPVVNHQIAIANNDLPLAAFILSSYVALFHWIQSKERRWLVLAGVLSGFAMGVKYLAIFSLAIQGILVVIDSCLARRRVPEILWDCATFGFSILATSGIWYLRSYLATGNPVYPYLTNLFRGKGLEAPLQLEGKGFGKGLAALALLPWRATFYPLAFGGTSNQWGPLFLGFIPWVLVVRRNEKTWSYVLGITTLTFILWFYTKQNLRFLLPALPFCCLIVAVVLLSLRQEGKWVAFVSKLFFSGFILLHLGIAVFQLRDVYRVALGFENSREYLIRTVPGYVVSEFLNETRPGKKLKVLSQEHRAYYFDGEVVRERAYRRLTQYDTIYVGRGKEFLERLSDEGFTHLLIVKGEEVENVEFLNRLITSGPLSRRNPVLIDRTGRRTYLLYDLS